MSSTNKTLTIELSQYISTDKPTYLSDYNGDMLKIDNAFAADRDDIATAQNTADGAIEKADTNKTSIDTLNGQINGDPTDPSDSGLAGKVNGLEGNVNTINSLIGNGEPTTTDKTLIGAINELNSDKADSTDVTTIEGKVSSLEGDMSAIHTRMSAYDINVNAAMVSADGVKTYSQLGDEVYAALNTLLSTLDDGEVIRIEGLDIPDVGYCLPDGNYVFDKLSTLPASIIFIKLSVGVSFFYLHLCSLKSASSVLRNAHDDSGISYVDMGSTAPASGSMFLKISRYKKL